MGQKVSPIGLRLGVIRDWDSKWYASKVEVPELLHEDLKIRIPVFSRVAAGALDLRRGPQGPALVASGKASPHASCSGASRVSSPVNAGA